MEDLLRELQHLNIVAACDAAAPALRHSDYRIRASRLLIEKLNSANGSQREGAKIVLETLARHVEPHPAITESVVSATALFVSKFKFKFKLYCAFC